MPTLIAPAKTKITKIKKAITIIKIQVSIIEIIEKILVSILKTLSHGVAGFVLANKDNDTIAKTIGVIVTIIVPSEKLIVFRSPKKKRKTAKTSKNVPAISERINAVLIR